VSTSGRRADGRLLTDHSPFVLGADLNLGDLGTVLVTLGAETGGALAAVLGDRDAPVAEPEVTQFLAGVPHRASLGAAPHRPGVDPGGDPFAAEQVAVGLGLGGEVLSERHVGPLGADRRAAVAGGFVAFAPVALGDDGLPDSLVVSVEQVGQFIET
jgi:hypothetical protein